MLGSLAEADDMVQEAWFRYSRTDTSDVANLRGWLTTAVARRASCCARASQDVKSQRASICRSRSSADLEASTPSSRRCWPTPSGWRCLSCSTRSRHQNAWRSCSTTSLPFRSTRSRQSLTGRLRRRDSWPVGRDDGSREPRHPSNPDSRTQRRIVDAFLAASRAGDFDALVATLDPDVVVHVDFGRLRPGGLTEVRGAHEAATQALPFRHQAPGARSALVNGEPGLVVFAGERPFAVLGFTIGTDRITEIYVLADPDRLNQLDFAVLDVRDSELAGVVLRESRSPSR